MPIKEDRCINACAHFILSDNVSKADLLLINDQ